MRVLIVELDGIHIFYQLYWEIPEFFKISWYTHRAKIIDILGSRELNPNLNFQINSTSYLIQFVFY